MLGLGSPSKRLSLVRLIEINRLDIVLFQESMWEGARLAQDLAKVMKDWDLIF